MAGQRRAGERRARGPRQTVRGPLAVAAAAVLLGACADSLPSLPKLSDLNPFAEKPVPLPGKRVAVNAEGNRMGAEIAPADKPVMIPAAVVNESWSQPGGTPANSPGNVALNASIRAVWSGDAGTGSSKYGKLSASPVVADGRVYTLDAAGRVTAFNVSGGGQAWRASVVPEGEKNPQKGYGGGLAYEAGRLYVATGFGTVVALDPRSGKELWNRQIGVPIRTSPTAAQDRIVVVTTEGEVICLSGPDGAENWRFKGLSERASFITNASPAIDGDTVVAPFVSGDVVALKLSTGQAVWTESLARTRTASSLAAMSDAARPAIEGGVTFAVGHAGRMIATNTRTGERLWSVPIPGIQQPAVAGDAVFVVDTGGQLMALTRRDGKALWTTKLAGDGTWSGPVLAGSRLWLVSSKGQLVSVDAATGKVASTQEAGGPSYIAPVVAGGRLFVLTDAGKLVAYN